MSYVTRIPVICIIFNANVSILQLKDFYIQQMIHNNNKLLLQKAIPKPTSSNNKRQFKQETSQVLEPPVKKIMQTTEYLFNLKRKWFQHYTGQPF